MVSYLSIVFCSLFLIALLLQQCTAEQQLVESNVELNSNPEDAYDDTEKRGGGRSFSFNGMKRAGGRGFYLPMDKRGGGRGFNFYDSGFAPMSDKRGGGRGFHSSFGSYLNYPLIYKKASDYVVPYYLQYNKRGGGRFFAGGSR